MRRVAPCVLAASLMLSACDRRKEPAPAPPTTRVAIPIAQTEASTQPAKPQPARFMINGQSFDFPPAKLVLKKVDDGVQATLFSDDPPEALKDDYVGNSFYFDVTLEADSIEKIEGERFDYRNSAGERSKSTTGIFVAGNKQVLQPLTAAVAFGTDAGQDVALVRGTFQLFDDQTPDGPPALVTVEARLTPQRVEKR